MVQSGWAVVYESAGAEYDGLLLPLKAAEGKAQYVIEEIFDASI